MAKSKGKETFVWTDSEVELLLESVKVFASNCLFEGEDWEGVKSKYGKIQSIFIERYPKTATEQTSEQTNEDFPKSSCLDTVTKERISAKLKCIRKSYKKAVDMGKKSGGGRIVMTYYDLCHEIWAGAPAIKSIESGIDSSLQNSESTDFEEAVSVSEQSSTISLCRDVSPLDSTVNLLVEDSSDSSSASSNTQIHDRREKIEKYLKDQREKKMSPQVSFQNQQLHCMKEDLSLKRKLAERSEMVDKEFFNNASKMSKTMENLAGAMTGCFQIMSTMFEVQMQQQQQQMQQQQQRSFHYGFQQPMPTNMCMSQQSTQQFHTNNVHFVPDIGQNCNPNSGQEQE